jgi:hypothetical protein
VVVWRDAIVRVFGEENQRRLSTPADLLDPA